MSTSHIRHFCKLVLGVFKILDSASAKLKPHLQSPLAMHTHLLGNVGTQVDRESQGRVCSLHKVTQLFTTLKLKTERWRPKMVTCSFKLPVQETPRKTARLPMSYFPAPGYPTHSHHLTVSKHCPISPSQTRLPLFSLVSTLGRSCQ